MNIWFAAASVFVVLAASMTIQPEQEAFGWILFAALVLLFFLRKVHGLFGRVLFLVLGGFISLRYFMFRLFFTMQMDSPVAFVLAVLLFVAECYAIGTHFLGIFLNVRPLHRPPAPLPDVLPSIDVFIPSYDEDPEVAVTTAIACKNFDYPAELINIYILDDGCRLPRLNKPQLQEALLQRHTQLKAMAEAAGVRYLTREDDAQAKAGMIRATFWGRAFSELTRTSEGTYTGGTPVPTTGELLLLLDCDHIPTRDMPKKLVGYFADPKVFLVQTPHFMLNADPLRKNIRGEQRIPCESWLFYQAIMKGLDRWNGVIFCGSAALLRRSILEEVDGLCGETITEDAETALALHSRGYTSVYVSTPLIVGLAPESVPDMLRQRARWCQGMMQMLILKNPLFKKGMALPQRLSYFNCCLYWLFPVFRFIFLFAPLAFLYFGLNIYNASTQQVIDFAVPHVLASILVAGYLYPRLRPLSMDDILEIFQTFFLLPAILAVCLSPRRPVFRTTRKGVRFDEDAPSWNAAPLGVALGLMLVGTLLGIVTWHQNPFLKEALAITLTWNGLNIIFVLCAIGAMYERRQQREAHRFPVNEAAELNGVPGTLLNLSGRGFHMSFSEAGPDQAEIGKEFRFSSGTCNVPVRLTRITDTTVSGAFVTPLSPEVIGFVYGDSARWQRHMEQVLHNTGSFGGLLMQRLCLTSALVFGVSMFRRIGKVLGLILLLFLAGLWMPKPAGAEIFRLPVSDLVRQDSYVLDDGQSVVRIPVHFSRRRTVSSAKLDLRYALPGGEGLAKPESTRPEMHLNVDGEEVSGRVSRLSETDYLAHFDVPDDKLVPGERVLSLMVQQTVPQPLTLNLRDSTVIIEAELNTLPSDTRDFSRIFDPKAPNDLAVHVVLGKMDESHVLRAVRAVQTLALMLKKRPLSLSVSDSPLPDRDNILIVDAEASFPTLTPDNRFVLLREDELSTMLPAPLENILRRGTTRSFKDFGLYTLLIRPGYTRRNTPFLVSSETRLTPNHFLTISVDLAYSAGFSSDSRLELYMNDTVLTWVPLRNPEGARYSKYTVEVPTSRLKKGENTIGILPRLHTTTPATAAQQFVAVLNTSTLTLPDTGVYVHLPDLHTLFTDGYPFRYNTVIHLENPTPGKAAALLNLAAFIAQHRGSISHNPSVHFAPWTGENRNAYVLTVNSDLQPDSLLMQETLVSPVDQTLALNLSAPTEAALLEGTRQLWKRQLQEGVHGEAVLVNLVTGELTPQKGETVVFSDVWPFPTLAFYTNNNPLATRVGVCMLLIGFAGLGWFLLKRRDAI